MTADADAGAASPELSCAAPRMARWMPDRDGAVGAHAHLPPEDEVRTLLARLNIDESTQSSAARSSLRHSLGSQRPEQLVEAVAEAILSHVLASPAGPAAEGEVGPLQAPFEERPPGMRPPELRDGVPPAFERGSSSSTVDGAEAGGGAVAEARLRDALGSFLWSVLDGMALDPECLIIALVLLERVVLQPEPRLRLTASTWRLATTASLLLATKTWYDNAVYSVDFTATQLCTLEHLKLLERTLLGLLDFQTAVPVSLYARYFFALQDVGGRFPEGLRPFSV